MPHASYRRRINYTIDTFPQAVPTAPPREHSRVFDRISSRQQLYEKGDEVKNARIRDGWKK